MFVNLKGTDWPEHLQLVLMAMRSAVNKATGETPYYLVTGFDMVLPYDLITKPGRIPYNVDDCPMARLRADAPRVFHEVRERMRAAARRSKEYYDRRTAEPKFQLGGLVYLRVPVKSKGIGKKFKDRYTGPWRLEEQLSPSTWRLRKVYGRKTCITHCDRLKHAAGPDDVLADYARDEAARGEVGSDESESGAPLEGAEPGVALPAGGGVDAGEGVAAAASASGSVGGAAPGVAGQEAKGGSLVAAPRRSARIGNQLRPPNVTLDEDMEDSGDEEQEEEEWETDGEDAEQHEPEDVIGAAYHAGPYALRPRPG